MAAPAAADGDAATWDVVVIGAGLSGLSAARTLHARGKAVVVLEARDRVGGRTRTDRQGGVVVDAGGAYVGPTQNRVLRVADELGVKTYRVGAQELRHVLALSTEPSRAYHGTIPSFGPVTLLDVNHLVCLTERLAAEEVSAREPWACARAREWDRMTVEHWLQTHAFTQTAIVSYRAVVQAILSVEASECSMLYWLHYVSSAGGLGRLMDVDNGAQERKFVGGAQQLSEGLARGLDVRLESPVARVEHAAAVTAVTTRDGRVFRAREHIIVAVAPPLYTSLGFAPPLPPAKRRLAEHMRMGSIIKTWMRYDKPYWRLRGASGSFVSDEGPIVFTYDDCAPDGESYFGIMGFLLAGQCRKWQQLSKAERKEAIAAQYARTLGIAEMGEPLDYHECDWTAEEFSGGCYVGVMPPELMTDVGEALRAPLGRVLFAGTETATRWAGYMDGAVQAGERAAHEALGEPFDDATAYVPRDVVTRPSGPSGLERALARLTHFVLWCRPAARGTIAALAVAGAAVLLARVFSEA